MYLSQSTFNHALNVNIIIYVSFKRLSFPIYILLEMKKKMHIKFGNTITTRSNVRIQTLV